MINKKRLRRAGFLFLLITNYLLLITIFSGCGPTYPKEKFKESIIRVCKDEYKLDVKVDTLGKTIAIYFPVQNLIDETFAISKSASEELNNVILSVSRVALSTDVNFDFYCVIAHDVRVPEVQIIIIKSVDDVKRFLLNDISRTEYSKRMLVDIRLSPQAQKEHDVAQVFEKMGLDKKWQEQVVKDFFSSAPATLGDIGYWNGRFYVKDITILEFLAEQIASRVKMEFKENSGLSERLMLKSTKGFYYTTGGSRYFKFEVLVEPRILVTLGDEDIPATVFRVTANTVNKVLRGYMFTDFDYAEIVNQSDGQVLKISREDLEKLRTNKLKFEDVLR